MATDANQSIVWRWESDAYGAIAPQGSVTVNLRFPGQYFDAESGWYYNWNRYYDPDTGRYWTSDPIGLWGGWNTYEYVEGNPVNWVDPSGLKPPGPVIDPATGSEVGRFIVDSAGNTMIEPVGGWTSDYPPCSGCGDTHTYYPNGSNYHRLNPNGHANNPIPHGHGHLQGTGPGRKGQGSSIDPLGNEVKPNSSAAHWPIIRRICPRLPGILMLPSLVLDAIEFNKQQNSCVAPYCI